MDFAFITHSPTTYPFDTPEIDNLSLARRKRRRTSPAELLILEHAFLECDRPSKEEREDLGLQTAMEERSVQIWFQNKRQQRKKSSPVAGSVQPSLNGGLVLSEVEQKSVDSSSHSTPTARAGRVVRPSAKAVWISKEEPLSRKGSPLQLVQKNGKPKKGKKKHGNPGKENIDPDGPEHGVKQFDDECAVGLLSLSNGQWS